MNSRKSAVTRALGYAGAFTAGAAVMVYEFMAVRFLQPHFGGSLDVWAAETAVCLAGLAAGYALGGVLADRVGSAWPIGAALFVAGMLGFLIEPLAQVAGRWSLEIDQGLRWHPLAAAGLCTFLPLLALGTVAPQAVRLETGDMQHVGRSAGWVTAVGTAGSIAGVLLTVMLLMPIWGAIAITRTAGGVLAVAGCAGILLSLPRRPIPLAVLLSLVSIPAADAQVLYEVYSAYHHIRVADEDNTRILYFDRDQQSLMSLQDPNAGGFEYADFFHVPVLFDPSMKRVLFIGLGGGTGPKSFVNNYPEMKVDVLEIDPEVVEVAKEFFQLPSSVRLRVQVGDGRVLLQRAAGKYGAIMMDAYGTGPYGSYLPYHLATAEFFRIAWNKLDNGGCLVYNAVGVHEGLDADVIRDLLPTLESVFQQVYVFQARTSLNTVFVAQKIDVDALQDGFRGGKPWPEGAWLAHPLSPAGFSELVLQMPATFREKLPGFEARVTQFSPAYGARRMGTVLTDDFAPVDLLPPGRATRDDSAGQGPETLE